MKKFISVLFLLAAVLVSGQAFADSESSAQSFAEILQWVSASPGSGLPVGCWFCPLYREMFLVLNDMTSTTANTLQIFFQILLWIGGVGFVIFYVGKHMVSLQEIRLGDFWRGLAIPLGKIMIASLLLANIQTIYYFIINPAMVTSLNLGTILMRDSTMVELVSATARVGQEASQIREANARREVDKKNAKKDFEAWRTIELTMNNTTLCDNIAPLYTDAQLAAGVTSDNENFFSGTYNNRRTYFVDSQLFENQTYQAVQCFMGNASATFVQGVAMGLAIFDWACDSWINRFRELWIGLLVAACYTFLMIFLGMKLIDPLMRLTVVSALMPLWVVFWAIPATAGYTKKAWETLINVLAVFVMLSIVVAIISPVMSNALGTTQDINRILARMVRNTLSPSVFKYFGWKQALWCVGYTLISLQMLNSVEQLAQMFASGSGDMGITKALEGLTIKLTSLGATMARNATGLVKGGVRMGWSAGKYGFEKMRQSGRESREKEQQSSPSAGTNQYGGGSGGGGTP